MVNQKNGEINLWVAFLFSAVMALISVATAYATVGMAPPPYQRGCLEFAVYSFLFLAAIAAGDGRRSVIALLVTLLCGATYWYGLLCKPEYAAVSPTSTASAGFVFGSALYALLMRRDFPAFTIGTWWRVGIIFPLALFLANWLEDFYPYHSAELISYGTILGVVALLLEHLPLSLYDWGKLRPGHPALRILAIFGCLIMLTYYQAFGSDYEPSVVFNLVMLIDNSSNLLVDGVRYLRKGQ